MTNTRNLVWHDREGGRKKCGRTIAVIWSGKYRYIGISECSNKDGFNKKKGRLIALQRATLMSRITERLNEARENVGRYMFWYNSENRVSCHPDKFFKLKIPEWMYLPKEELKENMHKEI